MSFLTRGSVSFRQLEEEDLAMIRDWRNDPAVREGFREFRPLNMVNQKRWFASLDERTIMFVITKRGMMDMEGSLAGVWVDIGVCGLTSIDFHNRSAELSAYIGIPQYQEVIHDVIDLLLEFGFKELGLHRIYAEKYECGPDTGMELERHGFKQEGVLRDVVFRHGRYWNSVRTSKLESD